MLFEEFLEVLSDSFGHGLLVLAAASLFVHGVSPNHFSRTGLDQLDRDVSFVLDPSTICKQATGNLSTC